MTTDHYYHYQYSPPISPKSIPHGYKRKASLQDDELENSNNLISHSFKKLRLSKSGYEPSSAVHELNSEQDSSKRPSQIGLASVGVPFRDESPSTISPLHSQHPSRNHSYDAASHGTTDDCMTVDDTAYRVWVRDLDAEIAEIEAAEAEEQNADLHITDAGKEYSRSKVPEHLLRQNPSDPTGSVATDMQMILYRDPISISVPEEDDAVRKTIIEARQRMRDKQAKEREHQPPTIVERGSVPEIAAFDRHDLNSDSMELD